MTRRSIVSGTAGCSPDAGIKWCRRANGSWPRCFGDRECVNGGRDRVECGRNEWQCVRLRVQRVGPWIYGVGDGHDREHERRDRGRCGRGSHRVECVGVRLWNDVEQHEYDNGRHGGARQRRDCHGNRCFLEGKRCKQHGQRCLISSHRVERFGLRYGFDGVR